MKLKNLTQLLLENGIKAQYIVDDYGAPENPGVKGNITYTIEVDSDQKVKFFNFIAKHNDEWKMVSKDNVRYMEDVRFSTTDRFPKQNCKDHFMPKDVYGITIYGPNKFMDVDELVYTISLNIDYYPNYHLSFDVYLGGLK